MIRMTIRKSKSVDDLKSRCYLAIVDFDVLILEKSVARRIILVNCVNISFIPHIQECQSNDKNQSVLGDGIRVPWQGIWTPRDAATLHNDFLEELLFSIHFAMDCKLSRHAGGN